MPERFSANELDQLSSVIDAASEGPWEIFENHHVDPIVICKGRPFSPITSNGGGPTLIRLSSDPDDYGRSNLEYISTFDPVMTRRLVDVARAEPEIESDVVERLVDGGWLGHDGPLTREDLSAIVRTIRGELL